MARKGNLNPFERTILDVLRRAKRPFSIRQISDKGEMDWSTADKYTGKLRRRGLLACVKRGKKKMCEIKDERGSNLFP